MTSEREFILGAAIALFSSIVARTAADAFFAAEILNAERKKRGLFFEGESPGRIEEGL